MGQPNIETTVQRVLKKSLHRTVRLECWQERGEVVGQVVKRFHGAHWTRRLLDGKRARREQHALERMLSAGLPVPRPLALEKRSGCWELSTELVRDGLPLRMALEGFAPWPLPARRLAAPLGRLLAQIYAVGLDHADLHSGNVLIDPAGKAWLIDLGKSRLDCEPSVKHIEGELARLAGEVRECLDWRFRLRFLQAFLRALPEGLRAKLPTGRDWNLRIEALARLTRRSLLHRARLRWTRASSAVRPFSLRGPSERGAGSQVQNGPTQDGPIQDGWTRCGISDEQVVRLLEAAAGQDSDQDCLPSPLDQEMQLIVWRGLAWRELREHWYTSARLDMHHIPCARPLLIVRSPQPLAIFELPASSRSLGARHAAHVMHGNEEDACRRAASIGRLIGCLHDRGLSSRSLTPDRVYFEEDGQAAIGIGVPIEALIADRRARCWQALKVACAPVSRGQRAAFLAAYLDQQGAGPDEVLRLGRGLRSE